jgi:hypothetical protein
MNARCCIQTLNEFNACDATVGHAIDYATATLARLEDWRNMSSAQMRLQCGEMTAEQIRIVRAILNVIAPPGQ